MRRKKLSTKKVLMVGLILIVFVDTYGQSKDIFQAIQENNLSTVKSFLKDDPEILSSINDNKYTPLHLAAESGNLKIAKLLIKNGANVNAQNHLGETPLHLAATGGDWAKPPSKDHQAIISLLVSNGADLNIKNTSERTPAFKAIIYMKGIEVISYLINNGTNLANNDDAFQLLSRSCERGYPEIADLLLDKNIKLPTQESRLVTLIYRAGYVDQLRLFNLILESKPDILEGREESIVSWAAESGSVNILNQLVDEGLSLHVTNRYGNSLIHSVAKTGKLEVMKFLIDKGLDINSKNSINKTALHIAREYNNSEIEAYLIQKGATQESYIFPTLTGPYLGQDPPGDTPVMFAPGIVSVEGNEHSPPTFSNDGNEAYWVQEFPMFIFESSKENGSWTQPKKVAFNYGQGDGEPFLSNDNNKLFFLSSRTKDGMSKSDRERIWYVERSANGWSEPICLNDDANLYPMHWTISSDMENSIYFSSSHSSGMGNRDLFKTRIVNGTYQKPENLGPAINTELSEATPFIAPDQDYLIFSIRNHPKGEGRDDLFISYNLPDGWSEPINLGKKINTGGNELCPLVTPDGKYLFFLRIGSGDIYWVSTSFIEELRPKN